MTWNFDNSLHRQNALYEGTEAVFSICALTLSVQLDRTQKAIRKQETSQIDSQIVVRTEPTLPSLKKTSTFWHPDDILCNSWKHFSTRPRNEGHKRKYPKITVEQRL